MPQVKISKPKIHDYRRVEGLQDALIDMETACNNLNEAEKHKPAEERKKFFLELDGDLVTVKSRSETSVKTKTQKKKVEQNDKNP